MEKEEGAFKKTLVYLDDTWVFQNDRLRRALHVENQEADNNCSAFTCLTCTIKTMNYNFKRIVKLNWF